MEGFVGGFKKEPIEVFIEGVIEESIEGFIDGMSDGMTIDSLAKANRSRATASLSGGGGDVW